MQSTLSTEKRTLSIFFQPLKSAFPVLVNHDRGHYIDFWIGLIFLNFGFPAYIDFCLARIYGVVFWTNPILTRCQKMMASVAFSCALRRDKLDEGESWPRFGSTPNLLRSSGSRPWTAFASGGCFGVAHQTFCEIRAQGPFSLFCEWDSVAAKSISNVE